MTEREAKCPWCSLSITESSDGEWHHQTPACGAFFRAAEGITEPLRVAARNARIAHDLEVRAGVPPAVAAEHMRERLAPLEQLTPDEFARVSPQYPDVEIIRNGGRVARVLHHLVVAALQAELVARPLTAGEVITIQAPHVGNSARSAGRPQAG